MKQAADLKNHQLDQCRSNLQHSLNDLNKEKDSDLRKQMQGLATEGVQLCNEITQRAR